MGEGEETHGQEPEGDKQEQLPINDDANHAEMEFIEGRKLSAHIIKHIEITLFFHQGCHTYSARLFCRILVCTGD